MPWTALRPGFGAQFETYASQRVRGAMLDGLRENDWLPRGLRRDLRRIEAAISQLEHATGAGAFGKRTGRSLGMTLADYQNTLQDARGHQIVYFDDLPATATRIFSSATLPTIR
jgi:RNA polymerase sigma factor FliA